jgi:UDP-GlcNAc:undecaprenyl-phosphate GlcNAc-1-phosphate transferase
LGLAVLLLVLGRGGAALALGLAGALAGFLVLNWHPARMFLGDGGSHMTGAMLALLTLSACSGRGWCALPAAALVIGLPVVDTAWVIARRLISGQRVMAGGRDHLYDLMHRAGLSVRLTVLLFWLVQALLVAGGVMMLRRAQ